MLHVSDRIRTNSDILMVVAISLENKKYASYGDNFTPVVWHASLSKSISRNVFEKRFDKEKKNKLLPVQKQMNRGTFLKRELLFTITT